MKTQLTGYDYLFWARFMEAEVYEMRRLDSNTRAAIANKREAIARIISRIVEERIERVLVVGCGTGLEAEVLAKQLQAEVLGIDLENRFDDEARQHAQLEVGDAMSLRFPDASFDLVYSYHALEHISNPLSALEEMNRVLKDGGHFWIGTPNRNRFVGYVGSQVTTAQKIAWNLHDWKARLTGKFKNELGAHAGFTAAELKTLLRAVFSTCTDVSDLYYREIYKKWTAILHILSLLHLTWMVYPSVYFVGSK